MMIHRARVGVGLSGLALLVVAACTPTRTITAGDHHTCAKLDDDTLSCWGSSFTGELGRGNTSTIGDNETPGSLGPVPVGVTVLSVSAGNAHTCAVTSGLTARCWGYGFFGRLGYGSNTDIGDNEPAATPGDIDVGGSVTQIAAGGMHTCALLTTGTVRCWGHGGDGALGYGNLNDIGDNETPASAGDVSLGGTATKIVAGTYHSCALLESGAIRCWGSNAFGALGYVGVNYVGATNTPADAGDVPLGARATDVAAGYGHTCALMESGAVRCWGYGDDGRLGYGNTNDIRDAARASDIQLGGTAIAISAGTFHTCAILTGGGVRCWGRGDTGQLGYGNANSVGDDETPASVPTVNVGGPATAIAAGGGHTCAVVDNASFRCWGLASSGALGYGNTANIGDDETPASAGDVAVP